jgi:hypothetical protein
MAASVFGQTNASLSGTVSDATGAVIPGVSVKATNDNTGVVSSTVSNAAGVYNFPSLMAGVYTVGAEHTGFQTQRFTKVELGVGVQRRLNFELKVGGVATQVEVSTSAEDLILESSSSVGDVLVENTVKELPLVNRNALDLVGVMSGVIMADNTIFNANDSSFAGVSAAGVNIQRDGIAVNDVRYPTGVNAATRINPDLVGEFKMILAPVDAEAGRGNAQIQVSTKSGTNDYHGSLVWNVQNTALDPNTWENNRNGVNPPWRNLHQWTGSFGGPIIKNKTFFFVLYDGQLNKIRTEFNVRALTPCAKMGIFRYYDRWNNGNFLRVVTDPGAAYPYAPVVDKAGNPTPPPYDNPSNPNSGPHNGILRYYSVFGKLLNTPKALDCSDALLQTGTAWDPYRAQMDPTGYIKGFLAQMPVANNYDIGDGLNTAGSRWSRTLFGTDNSYGVGEDTYRRQINVRIDHNFNAKHRIHGSWSWERSWADNNFRTWPDGFGGQVIRRPQVLTVNFISGFSPSLLNEFRFGMSRTGTNAYSPWDNPETGDAMKEALPQVNDYPILVGAGASNVAFRPDDGSSGGSHNFGGRGNIGNSAIDTSPRYSFGDTLSWSKGVHSFKFGGEYRRATSDSLTRWTGAFDSGTTSYAYAAGGDTTYSPVAGINSVNMPLLAGDTLTGNRATMEDLLIFLSGSLAQIKQWRFINKATQAAWNDPLTEDQFRRKVIQQEFSMFFKDDWKITPDLTLNLGLRYDYFGVPYIGDGLTTGFVGGSNALYGRSGRSVDGWMKPGERAEDTQIQLIGPGSPHPDEQIYASDYDNIGPAVGFSWQFPWFGRGKTVLRGGYQISYMGNNGRAATIQAASGQAPGTSYLNSYTPSEKQPYLDLTNLPSLVPVVPMPSDITPGIKVFPVTDRKSDITAFEDGYKTPYVQNLTLALSRNVTSNLSVDIRYIGTLSRSLYTTMNINQSNFLTNGLLDAFDAARAGGESALLDALFMGQRLGPGEPIVNGTTVTGAGALRISRATASGLGMRTQLRQYLALGQYSALATALNFLGTPAGQLIRQNGFPENFIKTNPQFNNVIFQSNASHANYHSMQAQVTLRPTAGVSFQSTYTWSKNLGVTGTYTDPFDRAADYSLLPSNRAHAWVTYGSYDLPFLKNQTSGLVKRLLDGWQTSWITRVQSGQPLSITAQSMLYANGVPDVVGNFDFNDVGTLWPHGAKQGDYFSNKYVAVRDPQCNNVATVLQSLCTLEAIALASDPTQLVFATPAPGKQGNFGRNRIVSPTRWFVDMAISKYIRISEGKSVNIRVDATNILNHPTESGTLGSSGMRLVFPTPPITAIGATFGDLPYKVGGRTFQFMARFTF